ncbi:DUF7527 domain-containing protein [Haloferax prahovense]|uniref:DUF7527 domain-containing protein n=1 Tax=Haloferax prahovense TaxID=381852 RepID=UPI003C70F335
MDSEIIDAVTGWDSAPAERGYGGLRSLADDGFTGAVVAGMTWGFMLNGRLLGVFDGTVADFEGESFEAHRAPDPALPLLYAMRETGGDIRAQYYTEETPLGDADGTLSAGGFTGYVELSENVLSGDYYVVYHGGKSMSAAFVGNSKRLVTGDDAFERASDEVGIYKVYDVDLDLVDIPEPEPDEEEDEDAAGVAATGGEADTTGASGKPETPTTTDETSTTGAADNESERAAAADPTDGEPATADAPVSAEPPAETAADPEPPTSDDDGTETTDEPSTGPSESQSPEPAGTEAAAATDRPASDEPASPMSEGPVVADAPQKNGEAPSPDPLAEDGATGDDVFSAEAQWRNARSIPSLDPRDAAGESVDDRPGTPRSHQGNTTQATHHRPSRGGAGGEGRPSPRDQSNQQQSQPTEQTPDEPDVDPAEAESLKERVESLASERDRLESERDALREERDEHRSRAEELEDRVAELESEVDRLRDRLDEAGVRSTDRSMSADEALRGTNLFVRYAQKGQATLEKAHDGQASREEVIENLRLEHHTTFDTEGLGIDGQPYEAFLHETPEYGFAKWVVTDLLYEIGETGNRSSLAGVFDSIPKADRIELYGSVSVPIGDDESESRQFDVIVRDQMGEPLFVANLNDSRDPATQPMVTQLIKDSKAVADAKETLGSAFVVTRSFFEPEALEAATAETGGGLLSRSKRKSFVKLSRKQGYHLCLVEARGGEFHLNVPDL